MLVCVLKRTKVHITLTKGLEIASMLANERISKRSLVLQVFNSTVDD